MFHLWPFNPPAHPGGLLSKAGVLIDAAYWDGVKDGSVVVAIGLVLLFLFFHKND
jgi:hypothetical protein